MTQIVRQSMRLAVLVLVSVMAISAGSAMGPMAGPGGASPSPQKVSPDSCMACDRVADWQGCHETALALAMERDWSRAIAIEEGVHRAQPRNAEVAAVLARMYQEGRRNLPRAFELYHEAMSITPGYPPALLGLGTMMQDSGSLEVAVRYFRRGATERPDEPQFKVRLAEALVKVGREVEARPILDEIVERWPGSREAEAARRLIPTTALARP
jgi:tetratricopeptide (TPR) repeat protein